MGGSRRSLVRMQDGINVGITLGAEMLVQKRLCVWQCYRQLSQKPFSDTYTLGVHNFWTHIQKQTVIWQENYLKSFYSGICRLSTLFTNFKIGGTHFGGQTYLKFQIFPCTNPNSCFLVLKIHVFALLTILCQLKF